MSPPKVLAALDAATAADRGAARWPRCTRAGRLHHRASAAATPAACGSSRSRRRTCAACIKAMDTLYPGLGEHLEEETTVAIDGEMSRDRLFPAGEARVPRCSLFRRSRGAEQRACCAKADRPPLRLDVRTLSATQLLGYRAPSVGGEAQNHVAEHPCALSAATCRTDVPLAFTLLSRTPRSSPCSALSVCPRTYRSL